MLITKNRKRGWGNRFIKEYNLSFQKIFKKYNLGWSLDNIAEIFDCDRSVIIRTLKENNVNLRTNKEGHQFGTLYYKRLKARIGKNNPNYKSDIRVNSSNYATIRYNGQAYPQHKYIIEQKIKHKLSKNEFIHHIDGNRRNNRIRNLVVLKGRAEHSGVHASLQRCAYILVQMGIIKFNKKCNEYILNIKKIKI